MKKKWRLRSTEGQSLVEMALVMPLLLLMFVGLIEIGFALRNYLVLVNANREGARFAARGRWFEEDSVPEIFNRVVAAAGVDQRGDELIQFMRTEPIGDLDPNTVIRVAYIQVPDQVDATGGLVDEPPTISVWSTGPLPDGADPIDVHAVAEAARQENYIFNANYYASDPPLLDVASEDNFVIVETWYEHEQWLKLPIFTAILPETFTLYAHSTMRVTLDTRVE
jgi:hypothetical protein